jgi:hypothetical protein
MSAADLFAGGVGIPGQYFVRVALVPRKPDGTLDNDNLIVDFLDAETFVSLKMLEQGRNVLPTFELEFKVYDYRILPYANQGNQVLILMGLDNQNYVLGTFKILTPRTHPSGQGVKTVTLSGVYDAMGYMEDVKARIFKKMTAFDALKKVVKPYFERKDGTGLDFSGTSDDEQTWVQPGVSDRSFVNHLHAHANVKDSFPAVAVTMGGDFRCVDFKKHVRGREPDWIFASEREWADDDTDRMKKTILYDHNVADISKAGILNLWKGTGSSIPVYDTDAGGPTSPVMASVPPGLLSGLAFGNRDPRTAPRQENVNYQNANMHPEFWAAKSRNLQGLALYSSQALRFTFSTDFRRIRVLDTALFKDAGAGWGDGRSLAATAADKYSFAADDYTSGLYVVSKIARHVSGRDFKTYVELCRESPGKLAGGIY